jgi:BclB C-terminal domain-containing protein
VSLVGTTVTIQAQLYASAAPNDTFSPVAGTLVTLSPGLTGVLTTGTTATGGLSGLSIPVTTGTRLMVVFSTTATGASLVNSTPATVSAGIGVN